MKLAGNLTILQEGDNSFRIRLRDTDAAVEVVDIRLSLGDLDRAFTCAEKVPCTFSLSNSDRIGKIRQGKEHPLLIPYALTKREAQSDLARYLSGFEADGWQACIEDVYDPEKHVRVSVVGDKGILVRIGFVRWVDRIDTTPTKREED